MSVQVHGVDLMIPILGFNKGMCTEPEHERNKEIVVLRAIYSNRQVAALDLACMVCACRWSEQILAL